MLRYFERTTKEAHFHTEAEAQCWAKLKHEAGYEIAGPFENGGFALNHEFPWKVRATSSMEVEAG